MTSIERLLGIFVGFVILTSLFGGASANAEGNHFVVGAFNGAIMSIGFFVFLSPGLIANLKGAYSQVIGFVVALAGLFAGGALWLVGGLHSIRYGHTSYGSWLG